jgi:hypothetical protein
MTDPVSDDAPNLGANDGARLFDFPPQILEITALRFRSPANYFMESRHICGVSMMGL